MTEPKKTLLVLDDDRTIIDLLEMILKASDYRTVSAATVPAALKRVRTKKPDLIISDIRLPVGSGFDLYWKMKDNPETSSIPFVFISSYVRQSAPERKKIENNPGPRVVFLEKLFTPQELLQNIKALLDEKEGS